MSGQPMTPGERAELRSLTTKRAKVEKAKTEAIVAQLIANGDAELDRVFTAEDLNIKQVFDRVEVEVDQLRAVMNAQLDALGVSDDLRPSLVFGMTPGGWRSKDHRAELRRKVRVEAEAAGKRRDADVDAWELAARTELAAASITSDAALSIMAALPDVTEALPVVADLVGPVEVQPIAVIESTRDARRLAIVGALRDGSRSDREIGRLLGIDHKTVAKVRAEHGETYASSGELPQARGEVSGGEAIA